MVISFSHKESSSIELNVYLVILLLYFPCKRFSLEKVPEKKDQNQAKMLLRARNLFSSSMPQVPRNGGGKSYISPLDLTESCYIKKINLDQNASQELFFRF